MTKAITTPRIPDRTRSNLCCTTRRGSPFKDLVETRSMASRDQPQTALDEARHAIPQQGRERKYQPRCHIKTFDPRARARDQDRKQVASPGFGRSHQVNGTA